MDLRRLRPVVSVSIITSSITMFWSRARSRIPLDMRNAVTFFALNLESVQNVKQDTALRPKTAR